MINRPRRTICCCSSPMTCRFSTPHRRHPREPIGTSRLSAACVQPFSSIPAANFSSIASFRQAFAKSQSSFENDAW